MKSMHKSRLVERGKGGIFARECCHGKVLEEMEPSFVEQGKWTAETQGAHAQSGVKHKSGAASPQTS